MVLAFFLHYPFTHATVVASGLVVSKSCLISY